MTLKRTKPRGVLFWMLFLAACHVPNIIDISTLKEGEQLPSPEGLLVGTLRWQQGEQGMSASGVQIRNITTGEVYRHWLETPDVRLALPEGQYVFERIWGQNLDVRVDRTAGEKVAPWLLNVVTLPLGGVIIPTGKVHLSFAPTLPPFVIKQAEVSYIGTLTLNLPDPLPSGPYKVQVTTTDDGDEILKEFQARFPGTARIEKRILQAN